MSDVILNFIDMFVFVANGLVVVSIITSWVPSLAKLPGNSTILGMAEVLLLPARKLIPPNGMLDWSPLITIVGLQLIQGLLHGFFN